MNLKYIKRITVAGLLLFCLSVTTFYATVTQEQIDHAKDQVDDLQQKVEDAENTLDQIHDKKENLEEDLNSFHSELDSLVGEMNRLEDQITSKQDEIQTVSEELKTAEETVQKQYEDMKKRIRYMYENGDTSMMSALFESGSLVDMINRAGYVSSLMEYDRQKLGEYKTLQLQIAEQKTKLEEEESNLLVLKDEMGKKRAQVDLLIANTQQNLSETNDQAANAAAAVEDLEAQLAYWEQVEAELEAQKLAQDMKLWQEIQQAGKEDLSGITYTAADGELYLLAAIIQCESDGEPYAGKLAVGSVVLNRVRSSRFPNTITEVIYQNKQFSPVASGRLAYRLSAGVNDTCIQAATEVLNGNITTDALFFRRAAAGVNGTVIGNHVFY